MVDSIDPLEIVFRDLYSSSLKKAAQDFDEVNRKVLEGGVKGAEAWSDFRKIMDSIGGASEKNTKALGGFTGALLSIPKTILAPLGVAAALFEVGRALTSFTANQIGIRNMAADAGYATDAFKHLENTFQLMGYSAEAARTKIIGFGQSMNELRLNQQHSKFFLTLSEGLQGGYTFASGILDRLNRGEPYENIILELSREHAKQARIADAARARGDSMTATNAERVQLKLEEASRLSRTELSTYEERFGQAVKPTAFDAQSLANQQKLNDAYIKMWQEFYVQLEGVEAGGINKIVGTAESLMDRLNKLYELIANTWRAPDLPEGQKPTTSEDTMRLFKEIWDRRNQLPNESMPQTTQKTELDREKNSLLTDILSLLKRMENDTSGIMPSMSSSGSAPVFPDVVPGSDVSPTAPWPSPTPSTPRANWSGSAVPVPSSPPVAPGPKLPIFAPSPSFTSTFGPTTGKPPTPTVGGLWNKLRSFMGSTYARADGGPIMTGARYLVGERGAELIVPKLKSYIEHYRPVAPNLLTTLPLPSGSAALMAFMKNDASTGHHARSGLRELFGLDDPKEPAPWQTGEAARQRLDQAFADIVAEQTGRESTLKASVDFGNMTSLDAERSREVFLPVEISTAPKAVKAGITYDRWAFQ